MALSNSTPKVFLDLDGVLADFFGAWAQRMGGTSGADWDYIKQFSQQQRSESLVKLAHSPDEMRDFFANLQMLTGGKAILNWLDSHHKSFSILSAPIEGRYSYNSIEGKRKWLKTHGLGRRSVFFTRDKYVYATQPGGAPNLLIDDYGKNVAAWRHHGGIAIKHNDPRTEHTLHQLSKIIG